MSGLTKEEFEDMYDSLQDEEVNDMSEAEKSISSVVYYRGVSTTITRRDDEVDLKPMLEKQLNMIDWLLDDKGCKPSWNEDTNKVALDKDPDWVREPAVGQPTLSQESTLGNCNKCGAKRVMSKNNKPYCSAKCWLKD